MDQSAENDTVSPAESAAEIARLITASIAGRRWRDMTPLDMARYLVANDVRVIPPAGMDQSAENDAARLATAVENVLREWENTRLAGTDGAAVVRGMAAEIRRVLPPGEG